MNLNINFIIALLLAITVHEAAHAWMANHLGDDTAKKMGRLTLNPLAHLDPIGTIALLFVGFGWGKPVPFNPYNLKYPVRDGALIALAGPASNLILAIIFSIPFKYLGLSLGAFLPVIIAIIQLNVILMAFNLLPIAPLDGEKIIHYFLNKLSPTVSRKFSEISPVILISLVAIQFILNIPVFWYIIGPISDLTFIFINTIT